MNDQFDLDHTHHSPLCRLKFIVFAKITDSVYAILGVVDGKSETNRDSKTGILKSKPKTKKCNDFQDRKANNYLCNL